MGVVQNSIDIQKIIEAGVDPEIAAKVQELEAEIGDENSGIIKDIDDLQEANALVMTSVRAIDLTATAAKNTADAAIPEADFFTPAKKAVPQYNGDLDDLEPGDVVYVGGTATHAPAGYVLLYTMSVSNLTQSNNYMLQFGIGAASNPLLYVRYKENGTWKNWRKFTGTEIVP